MNALLWAAWFGHVQSLCILIKAGAGSETKNKNGLGFLHCAATNGHVEVINICQQVNILRQTFLPVYKEENVRTDGIYFEEF